MFKPFMDSIQSLLGDVDPMAVSENQDVAAGAPQDVRDGDTGDTPEKCRNHRGHGQQLSLEYEVP